MDPIPESHEAASAELIATAERIAREHRDQPGALLPILHAVQDACGYVPPAALPRIAAILNLSRAEVHGVVSYYHHFRTEPPARHRVEICRAESCQARGAEQLADHAQKRLGCGFHEHSADGAVSLEPVYCLGLCAQSPAIAIDGQPHARLTPEGFDHLIATHVGEAS